MLIELPVVLDASTHVTAEGKTVLEKTAVVKVQAINPDYVISALPTHIEDVTEIMLFPTGEKLLIRLDFYLFLSRFPNVPRK